MNWKRPASVIVGSLLLSGCASKSPIKPIEERVLNPFLMGCTCTKLSDAELNHLFLIGDKLWQETLADNEWCSGKLEELTGEK